MRPRILFSSRHRSNLRSDDIYNVLRDNLLERVRDKESPVRVQAAFALSKLCGSEDDPNVEPKITDIINDVLTYDTTA